MENGRPKLDDTANPFEQHETHWKLETGNQIHEIHLLLPEVPSNQPPAAKIQTF